MTVLTNLVPVIKSERVPVPNLGKDAEIIVRQMPAGDQSRYLSMFESCKKEDGEIDVAVFNLTRLMCCMVDEEGNYITEEDELDKLKQLDSDTFAALITACDKLNPIITKDDLAEKKS